MPYSWLMTVAVSTVVGSAPADPPAIPEGSRLEYADIACEADGTLSFPFRIIRGVEAVAQRLRIRFNFWLGEWFLDQRLGVPYIRDILVRNPDRIFINLLLRQIINTTPGVAEITEYASRLINAERQLAIDFRVRLSDGSILDSRDFPPFIIGF